MQWQRAVLGLHVACVLLAYALGGWAYLSLPRITVPAPVQYAAVLAVCLFAATGFLAGLVLMAGRSGKSERVALAFSTVAAFLLLVIAL
jgi:hypothetical protein